MRVSQLVLRGSTHTRRLDGNSSHAAEAWRNADTNDLEDTKKATDEVRVDEEKRQGLWTTRPPKSRAGRCEDGAAS